MTAPMYRAANNEETIAMRAAAPTALGAAGREGNSRMSIADAQPANKDAATYFHTASIKGAIPRFIGLPAYQNAGNVRIQKDTVHATAIPMGPQASPKRKSRAVTENSTMPQR